AVGKVIVANLLKMIPGAGTVLGGAISGSTAAALTLALGLSYIKALKIYVKAQVDGKEIPLSELAKIIIEQYKYYAGTGKKSLSDRELPPSD
ncbi:MAG: GTP-binding protein, partial [Moorea sp. SIO2I5]|nr:GTP-binding protein [Moorena sp. SIO2I5]